MSKLSIGGGGVKTLVKLGNLRKIDKNKTVSIYCVKSFNDRPL